MVSTATVRVWQRGVIEVRSASNAVIGLQGRRRVVCTEHLRLQQQATSQLSQPSLNCLPWLAGVTPAHLAHRHFNVADSAVVGCVAQ